MRTYAIAQNIGTRSHQCDAAAVFTHTSGTRAYALLDGIGSSEGVQAWTRRAARQVARAAARRSDAAAGLRAVYELYAADPDRQDPELRRWMPSAAAVVAVHAPGRPLTVAWSGDSRAYLLRNGMAFRLTDDHNARRVYPPTATYPEGGSRNLITSFLGHVLTDEDATRAYQHGAIDSTSRDVYSTDRLLLATDGAYEPHEDAGHDLFAELDEDELPAILRGFTDLAVSTSLEATAGEPGGPRADNASALLARLEL
ncbi:mucin-2 [Streptomyces sp. HUCO-GS316]|uniref:PP2C family protein-serine/threonine phosphatase n=1 Tax=Streptomyces sp. HUCO-GS316 TaxID=2692198 RepID=UPI0013721880|nr:mucin-2 [Streptomyces sp. HUCO-GS316]MXM67037.1 mucin-2 [Streptomyces sp. HUCO-GS316]